jgi:hypothetical protein
VTEHPDRQPSDPPPRLHLIHGATTLDGEGVSAEPVFVPCEALDALPADVLARLDVRPSLTDCGRHGLP